MPRTALAGLRLLLRIIMLMTNRCPSPCSVPCTINPQAIRTAAFGGVYFCEGDPLSWKSDWQQHWQEAAANRPAIETPRRRPGEPEIGPVERAALRKVGRKGGARMLPSSLVSEEAYATPLEEREMPPAMRKKRKLAQGGQAAAAATDVV